MHAFNLGPEHAQNGSHGHDLGSTLDINQRMQEQ